MEELRIEVRELRLDMQDTYLAMRRMQHHINTLTSDKLEIGGELHEARKTLDRVKALATRWDEGYSDWNYMAAMDIRDALKGDDDV